MIRPAYDIEPEPPEDPDAADRLLEQRRDASDTGNVTERTRREQPVEAAYRCRECDTPWVVFAVEGEPTDGVLDPRECRFCGAEDARRVR